MKNSKRAAIALAAGATMTAILAGCAQTPSTELIVETQPANVAAECDYHKKLIASVNSAVDEVVAIADSHELYGLSNDTITKWVNLTADSECVDIFDAYTSYGQDVRGSLDEVTALFTDQNGPYFEVAGYAEANANFMSDVDISDGTSFIGADGAIAGHLRNVSAYHDGQ